MWMYLNGYEMKGREVKGNAMRWNEMREIKMHVDVISLLPCSEPIIQVIHI